MSPASLTFTVADDDTAEALGSVVGLAVICTALAFVLFFALIAEVGPVRATVITYVNPAVAIAACVLLLGEPLTPSILTSFVLILGGCVLATTPPRRSAAPRCSRCTRCTSRRSPTSSGAPS